MRVVNLEQIEEDRRVKLGLSEAMIRAYGAMMSVKKAPKIGKRPVSKGGTFNQSLLSRSPGSAHKGMDFVKAVYAERTGQESGHYA